MTLPDLISISGYATAGKDAAADQLIKHHDYYKTYMSKPLEKALLTLDPEINLAPPNAVSMPCRYTDFHAAVGYDESKKNPEVRRLLQLLGTEIGRNMFGEDAWLNLVFEEIMAHDGRVALTGVRYMNELDRVRAGGGVSVWIHRPGVVPVNSHSSDNTLKPEHCDIVVANDGTLEDLYLNLVVSLHNFETQVRSTVDLWNQSNPAIGRVISAEEIEKGLKVEYTLDCKFGESTKLSDMSYQFICETHEYGMFMPIDKAPETCNAAAYTP